MAILFIGTDVKGIHFLAGESMSETMSGKHSATITFSNDTALPRNGYLSAMIKQDIGIYSVASNLRCEATTYTMPYLERFIAETCVNKKSPLLLGKT